MQCTPTGLAMSRSGCGLRRPARRFAKARLCQSGSNPILLIFQNTSICPPEWIGQDEQVLPTLQISAGFICQTQFLACFSWNGTSGEQSWQKRCASLCACRDVLVPILYAQDGSNLKKWLPPPIFSISHSSRSMAETQRICSKLMRSRNLQCECQKWRLTSEIEGPPFQTKPTSWYPLLVSWFIVSVFGYKIHST